MPVRWTNVELPMGGIDRKTDAPHVLPGKVSHLENARFSAPGAYDKRPAYTANGNGTIGGGSHTAPQRMLQHEDEILLFSEGATHSWSQQAGKWSVDKGRPPRFLIDREPIMRHTETTAALLQDPDIAYTTNMTVVTWVESTNFRYAIFDEKTGNMVSMSGATVGSRPRCAAAGAYVFIVYWTGTTLNYIRVDSSTLTAGSATAVPDLTGVTGLFDVAPLTGASSWILAVDDGAGNVDVHLYDTDGAQTQTSAIVVNPGSLLSVCGTSGENVYVVCDDGTDSEVYVRSATDMSAVAGPANFLTGTVADRVGVANLASDSAIITWDYARTPGGGVSTQEVHWAEVNNAASVTSNTAAQCLSYCQLLAAPFVDNSRAYVPVTYTDPRDGVDPNNYVYEIHNGTAQLTEPFVLGAYSRGIADGASGNFISHVASPATSKYTFAIEEAVDFAALDDDKFKTDEIGITRITLDAADANRFQTAPWGRSLFIAGGLPMMYDGVRVFECGHLHRPALLVGVDGTSDSDVVQGADAAGDLYDELGSSNRTTSDDLYRWIVVWEWKDANGQIHRSAPSQAIRAYTGNNAAVIGFVGGPNLKVTVTMPRYVDGSRHAHLSDIKAYLYRNLADPDYGDGSLYYLVGTASPSTSGGASATFEDGATGGTDTSDSAIRLNEPLYTNGGVLDNSGAPACKTVAAHGERLWVAGLEDPEEIRFTKKIELGKGPEFNEALSIRIPGAKRITALGTLDTALVAFTKTSTYIIYGDGPLATGQGGINLTVQRINADVGCDNPRSIVTTPAGLMFQAEKGIYLLDRSLRMHKSGAVVERVLVDYPTVTGAVLRANRTEVMFAVSDANAATNVRLLLYDYFVDQWAIHNVQYTDDPSSLMEYTGAALGSAAPTMDFSAPTDNDTYAEQTTFAEGGETPYSLIVETAPVSLNSIAGWQRVRAVTLIGESKASHSLKVSFEYDNDSDTVSSWTDSVTRTAAEMAVSGYPVKIHLPRQKMRTLRIRVEDLHETGTQGYTLSAIVLEAGVKGGTVRLPATSKD
jgi:hypothetical protein